MLAMSNMQIDAEERLMAIGVNVGEVLDLQDVQIATPPTAKPAASIGTAAQTIQSLLDITATPKAGMEPVYPRDSMDT